jgi:hypothetical protein
MAQARLFLRRNVVTSSVLQKNPLGAESANLDAQSTPKTVYQLALTQSVLSIFFTQIMLVLNGQPNLAKAFKTQQQPSKRR